MEPIKIDVKVNTKEIKEAQREIQKFANDNWKALDPNKVKKLEDERGRLLAKKRDAQTNLKNIRKLYDAWIVDNKQLAQAELAFGKISKATTEASRQMTNYKNTGDEATSRLQKKFDWLKSSILNVATAVKTFAIAFLARWITQWAKAVVKLAWDLEQAKIAFTTMLWSAEKANDLLEDLSKFASKTPFDLVWVRQNAKQLLAMGIASKDLLPTLKALWDVSAWLSVPLERLALNYWQVIAQGKLTGRELRDFTVAWVPILEQLAQQLGKTTTEIQWMISAWKISSQMVVQAFQEMSSWTGRFADLMWKQSETLQGKWSNLKDNVNLLWEKIGTALLPVLSKWIDLLNWLLDTTEATNPQIQDLQWKIANVSKEFELWTIDIFTYSRQMADLNIRLEEAIQQEEKLRKKIREVRQEMEAQEKKIKKISQEQVKQTQQTVEWTRALWWQGAVMTSLWAEMTVAQNRLTALTTEYNELIWKTEDSTKATQDSIDIVYDYWDAVDTATSSIWKQSKEVDILQKTFEDAFKNIEKTVEDSKWKIEDYNKEIAKIEENLLNLEKDRDISIAERVSKIDTELAWEDDPAKRAKLEAERAEAFVWLTEEEIEALQLKIDAQKEYDALTEIGKIKADYEAKKAIAEQELLDLQNKLSEEEALLEAYTQAKEQMERDYTEQFKGMIEEQKSAIDGLIAKYNALARAKRSAMGGGWSSTSSVVNNNQKTTTVNATVSSPTLVDYLVNKLSK
jgi:tape measure domain-containing protein